MKVSYSVKGDYGKSLSWLKEVTSKKPPKAMQEMGRKGVNALRDATPRRTGETALSWGYELLPVSTGFELIWYNTHVNNGVNIAMLLQYGWANGSTYIPGRDYINPALKQLFARGGDSIVRELIN